MIKKVTKNQRIKYVEEVEVNKLIRYDHKLSKLAGVKGSIIEDVRSLGATVLNYEDLSYYGFSLVEIRKELINPPHYIKPLKHFWEFAEQHSL